MKINEQIHYITLPYKDIFTTVYVLRTDHGVVLFDAASYDSDIDEMVVPFLEELGVTSEELKYVFISHNHKDHSGGLERFMALYPNTCIVSRSETLREKYAQYAFYFPEEGDKLLDTFRVVTIPGHTIDSSALLDERTMTLVTGDCLQQEGIRGSGDWASNISYSAEHLRAIEKLRTLGAKQLLSAHDYVPMGFRAEGEEAILKVLDHCAEPLLRLKQLILENPALDDEQIRELFSDFEKHLTINARVVAAMRKEVMA